MNLASTADQSQTPSPPSAAALPAGTPGTILSFYAYWASLPRTNNVPRLSDYLDNAPSALQPFVAIVDVLSPTQTGPRLIGTGFVDLLDRDDTGRPVPTAYSDTVRELVSHAAWTAVTGPAGYLCMRSFRTKAGRPTHADSICLPLFNRPGAPLLIVSYAAITKASLKIEHSDQLQSTVDFKVTHWIDIGAGVPQA